MVVGIVKIRYAVDESEVRERAIERSARLFAQGIDIAQGRPVRIVAGVYPEPNAGWLISSMPMSFEPWFPT